MPLGQEVVVVFVVVELVCWDLYHLVGKNVVWCSQRSHLLIMLHSVVVGGVFVVDPTYVTPWTTWGLGRPQREHLERHVVVKAFVGTPALHLGPTPRLVGRGNPYYHVFDGQRARRRGYSWG